MKINYFFKRNGFISSLKSKKAHDHYQIRASLIHGKKIKFSSIFDFILNGKYCTINDQSFFTLFFSSKTLYKYSATSQASHTKTLAQA